MINSKNILHVVNIYFVLPFFIGGQFKYFKKKGYSLHVACSKSDKLADYAKENGFDYIETPINRSFSIKDDIKTINALRKYINKKKIDIIVGHTPKGGLLAMLSGWLCRVHQRIYVRHGLVYETSSGFKRTLLKYIDRVTSYCATDIVCVSKSVLQKSIQDNLAPAHKQLVWGEGTCNGIDTTSKYNPDIIDRTVIKNLKNKYGIHDSDYIIGFSGRLVNDKGIVNLIEAFDLLENAANCKLLLVGMFEDRDALPNVIKERIINDSRIICTGLIDGDMENYYALMDLYVLPSFREGFPTGVLEAQSMELPVVTTNVTGCCDSIVNNVTGLFSSHSPKDIADKIDNIRLHNTIDGKAGRKWVKDHFDNSIVWLEIEKLYKK